MRLIARRVEMLRQRQQRRFAAAQPDVAGDEENRCSHQLSAVSYQPKT
jgi:hypothetical protein